jgi:hypothetical protein
MADKPICIVDGCDKRSHAGGMCAAHYHRLMRHGDPLGGRTAKGEAIGDIFRALETETDDCFFWTKARTPDGRGNVKYEGRFYRASRLVCILAHGEPEPNMEAAHSCGNGHLSCINKRHLRWATRKENSEDARAHGTMVMGERSPMARLNESDVRAIRRLAASGHPHHSIGAQFGISQQHASSIIGRKSWASVT